MKESLRFKDFGDRYEWQADDEGMSRLEFRGPVQTKATAVEVDED